MSKLQVMLGVAVFALGIGAACAQTPLLGNIEAPYAALQSSATIAGTQWGPGAVAYGPVGTPLVLTGSDMGGSGTVQFIAYKNGAVDTNVTPVQATVTMWTPTMLILKVPSGALSGLVKVTVEGKTSNGLPFMVTAGSYGGSCPASPSTTQLQITTASLHDGTTSQAYSATLGATGGTGAYTWSIVSGSLPSGMSLNASSGAISGTPTAAIGPVDLTFKVTDSGNPNQNDQALLSLTIEGQTLTSPSGGVYNYTATYDAVGNVKSYTDTVMGSWSITAPGGGSGYDSLNRLMGATATWPDGTQQSFCWQYDSFGNRLEQYSSPSAFQSGSGGVSACTGQTNAAVATDWASYNANNQITSTNARGLSISPTYDPHGAGYMLNDGQNQYLYDGDGRICAVESTTVPGMTTMTGYLYDAGGARVAKGTITTMSCDPATSGFQFTENYVLGPGGEELTQQDGNGNWQRTNVYAGGKLLATYDLVNDPTAPSPSQIPALHFHLTDPLGSRRMQLSGEIATLGVPETDIQSLPFGDQLNSYPDPNAVATADESTPLHFTGKERDTETGNDYFGARYYASSMGRFMSPDWGPFPMPVPFALRENPQSLNLYDYVLNNPLKSVDRNGHYTCYPDTSSTTTDVNGTVHLYITKGLCYFDPGDIRVVAIAKAQDWINHNLNPIYWLLSRPAKYSSDVQRLKDDKMLRDLSEQRMLAIMSNPMSSNDKEFDQDAATALKAEMDYNNVALYGIGADMQETLGLIEQFSPGAGTAVENAIKSGMDITEDSLSKTIQQAQGIKTD